MSWKISMALFRGTSAEVSERLSVVPPSLPLSWTGFTEGATMTEHYFDISGRPLSSDGGAKLLDYTQPCQNHAHDDPWQR